MLLGQGEGMIERVVVLQPAVNLHPVKNVPALGVDLTGIDVPQPSSVVVIHVKKVSGPFRAHKRRVVQTLIVIHPPARVQ